MLRNDLTRKERKLDVRLSKKWGRISHYDVLGKEALALLPQGGLIEFQGLGQAPQMEEPQRFHAELLKILAK
jgi:hypothetical protein